MPSFGWITERMSTTRLHRHPFTPAHSLGADDTGHRSRRTARSSRDASRTRRIGIGPVTPYLRIHRVTILPMTELERAWAELDAANTERWIVGRPSLHDEVRGAEHWEQWAYDPREKPRAGKR